MKKFLSLVLALVMTMSLVTVSAGAKDFTDSTKIQYTEAVDVMSAVNVISGYAEGDFRPSTTLTRGAAAKIICNLILGPTTAGALVADAAPYKDVPVNHTFAGYIAYCQKAGIISGYADGSFKPANSLTGYAFMKMLLGALGYDASREGYTGANWSINVAKQALNIGLDDGLTGNFNGVKAVTREEACLYAFNMLQADVVEYEKNSTITVGNITVTDNSAAKSKTWGSSAINDGNIDGEKGGDGYVQFAEEYFNKLVKTKTTDDMGRPATKWTNKGDKIGTYADKADQTYYKNVKLGDIYTDLGMTQKDDHATVIINGVEGDEVSVSKNNTLKISDSNNGNHYNKTVAPRTALVGDGSIVEVFYDDDTNDVTIVVSDVYVGEIASKETKVADPYVVVNYANNAATMVSTRTRTGYAFNNTNNQYECDTSAFAEDDIVLFTFSQKENSIQTVVKAESTEGVVSAYTTGKNLTLADKEYKYAKNIGFEMGAESDMNTKDSYTVYTDANGLAIYVSQAEFKPADYAFVLYANSTTTGKFTKDQAKLILSDGTVKTVDTDDNYASYEGTIVSYRETANKEYVLRQAPRQYTNGATVVNPDVAGAVRENGVLTGGKTPVATTTDPRTLSTSNFYMKNSYATIYPGTDNDRRGTPDARYANSETVFVVAELDRNGQPVYSAYTGIKNAPSIEPNTGTADMVYYVRGNNLLGFVFIDAAHCNVVNGKRDITFLAGKESMSNMKVDSDNNEYYEYNAVVDGQITTVKVRRDAATLNAGTKVNGVYQNVKYNSKGTIAISGVAPLSNDYTTVTGTLRAGTAGIWKLSGEYTIGLSGATASQSVRYTVASDAKMYLVDTDGVITKVDNVKDYISDTTAEYIALVDVRNGDIAYLFVQETDNGKKDDVGTTISTNVTLARDIAGNLEVNITGAAANADYRVEKVIVTNTNNNTTNEIAVNGVGAGMSGTLNALGNLGTPQDIPGVIVTPNGLTIYQAVLTVNGQTVYSTKLMA